MHNVEIEFYCIAQTRMNPAEVRKWLDRCGASEHPVPKTQDTDCPTCGNTGSWFGQDQEPSRPCPTCGLSEPAEKKKEVTDAGAVCGLCSKRCYMSFEPGLNPNVSRVRKDWFDYWGNVLKSRHGSVTEHASWTFAIEGVSRVFTAEMNRHRAGAAISEGSMRYIRFDDIGFWMPLSLLPGNMSLMPTRKCKACKGKGQTNVGSMDLMYGAVTMDECIECEGSGRINTLDLEDFEGRKANTRQFFEQGFKEMEHNYSEMCKIWEIESLKSFTVKKKLTSMFRRVIGMGVATGGCWTFNTRALRHILALRTAPGVEEEIAYVMGEIGKWIVDQEPHLFGDFTRDEATGAWVPEHVKV